MAETTPGAGGLVFAPVLGDGERDDPALRGAVTGLSLRHDRGAVARAALEGIACGVRARLDTLSRTSAPATELRVSGGGAGMAVWNQIKADVTGIPVVRVAGDSTAAGAAMLAGLGAGVYRDAAEAVSAGYRPLGRAEPDPAHRGAVRRPVRALPGPPRIEGGPMRARLGINTCFAVKRWPRPGDWARIVRDELGLEVVELSLDLIEDFGGRQRRDQVRSALDEYGLRAETVFTGLAAYSLNLLMHPDEERRRAAADWYLSVVDLAARVGARGAGGHVGAMSVPDWPDPVRRAERWSGLRQSLAEIAAAARSAGLEYLLVENLASHREPSTIAGLETLLTEGDAAHAPVRLCLDVGHQCVPGTTGPDRDPYAWLAHFGGRLAEVQLQQSDGLADHHWPFTPERNEAGLIDPGRVLDALAEAGAEDVLLVLEVIPAFEQDDAQALAGLRASAELWQAALTERGAR